MVIIFLRRLYVQVMEEVQMYVFRKDGQYVHLKGIK